MEEKITRIDFKIEKFAEIIKTISTLSNSSIKKVACMAIHKNFTKIASFGYNGSYSGAPINPITRTEEDSLEPGKSGFIHAEVNMIAKFREPDPENYIVLLTLSPCDMCTKILINSGFKFVYWLEEYREMEHLKIFDECSVSNGDIEKLKIDYFKHIKK